MRRTLLATVAAAALVAGTIAVSAQGMQGGGGTGGGGGGAPSAAPAEKMAPSGRSGTTGQGTGSQMDRAPSGQTQDRGPSATQPGTGQGQMERGQGQMERGQSAQPQRDQGQQPRAGQGQTGTKQQTGQREGGSTSAALTTEQRTQIRQTVLRGGTVNRVSNVNFSISVGTVVPRSVKLVAVPASIVEIHPAWRGFLYFVVEDEIIIVEPGTLKIVAVIT
jgi:hypothetical protein